MVRVVDYIADYVYKLGVNEIFLVTGGGMMFLADGVAKHPHLKAICTHHEQAAAMSAVSYARYNENIGVAYITTGCGGTNAITGLLGAWQDSTPCLFVSGQSKRKETVRNSGLPLRQVGVQEADIIAVVEPLTKYSVMINEPDEIAYHLDKAVYLAKTGRPGPVWIDVPLDVQGAMIDEKNLRRFSPDEINLDYKTEPTNEEITELSKLLRESKRPVIVAGQGIRLAKAVELFKKFVEKNQIPVVASRLGINILSGDHPLFIGRIGNKGDRPGNLAVQNADLVISMGSRLSVSSTGHEYDKFAREAKIVVVDVDPVEHKKNTVKIDFFINVDVRNLLQKFNESIKPRTKEWIVKCSEWKRKYPVYIPEYAKEKKGINLYYFVDRLSKQLKRDSAVISDAGSAFYVVSQGIMLKEEQRYITSSAQAEMGYTLPASVGVSVAKNYGEVIGITGDGSFQLNIQELQTILHYDLPIKIFVWNNDGYLSIRASQRKFFDERYIGTDKTSGVSFPELKKISKAYGIKYFKATNSKTLDKVIHDVLEYPKAVLCEVMCIRDQEIIPTVASFRKDDGTMISKPLEDMYPFLDRDEFYKEMIVEPVKED